MSTISRPLRTVMLFGSMAVASACGQPGDSATVGPVPSAPANPPGIVIVPANSPPLRQLRVAPVGAAELSADDVTAPGRVIVDPHYISRVLLPVQGRIISVLVGLGASVEQGQPVMSVDSPDADAAV